MNRAKTWALVAGMAAGLAVGPGCMMFDGLCDDECVCDRDYPFTAEPRRSPDVNDRPAPSGDARPAPAIP